MEEFYRIRRLPPYVFEQVNRAKAVARNAGADIIDLGMGNPDLPAPRQSVVLSEFEQQKLEDDLVAARDRQQAVAGVPVSKEPRRRQPPGPGVVPAVSGKAIY